jgi:Phytanoyl-CoA dioxygenase (PhyH)
LTPTELEIYLFDLRGSILLENALSSHEVAALNAIVDEMLPLDYDDWYGHVHVPRKKPEQGFDLQQIYEAGEPFEKLIDHPSWLDKVKYFVGGEGTFDYLHGPLFIDENFANVRGPGGAIPLHSGAHEGVKRTQFRYNVGRFMCGQINILIALTDIGPGDGATMVIPGSHKSNFPHPDIEKYRNQGGVASLDDVVGAVEVYMKAGDAILFVDALSHGSAERINPGDRRIIVYRYGPSWGNFRLGYQPSEALLARLTPERKKIVQPQVLIPRDPARQRKQPHA